jgi:hypothetical protein
MLGLVLRRAAIIGEALPAPQFQALQTALLESPLVGRSTLAGAFQSSRGFAVIFRDEGRAELTRHFPALVPWLAQALGAPALDTLKRWWLPRRAGREPNAWYLNVLLVSRGGTVGRHVDATLRKVSGDEHAIPEVVSVLYLSVPGGEGGQLALYEGGRLRQRIAPVENQAVHFRGDLSHEVQAFEGVEGVRASLVVEQYHLAPEHLANVPAFKLESRAGFGAYLDHHAARES